MIRVRQLVSVTALGVVLAVGVTACGKKVAPAPPAPPPPAPTATAPPAPPPPRTPPPPAPVAPPAPAALTEDQIFARKSLDQLNNERPLADVFFDLDEAVIRTDGRQPLQGDSDWLKRWTSTQITVEGHCDSRGSSEYNLALGTRRAQAVKDYLVNLGVSASRIIIISKGKEQPFCTEDGEGCWQQNRRGHFIVTQK
jgi:peptidoglycan-associated lipoprotein